MMKAFARMCLVLMLFTSAGLCAREAYELSWQKERLEDFEDRESLLKTLIESKKEHKENLRALDLKTLHREARKRRLHLPGESDWKLLESRNSLYWNTIWSTQAPDEGKP